MASLRAGFRAKYIIDAANKVSSGEIDFDKIAASPIEFGRQELQKIKGVGKKVAECTLLYGFGKYEAFPEDVCWFVMADTNTPQEIIRQDLTLEEAIQIYQDSNTSEKRLGVIKDGIATVDFVHFQSGEQQFFTDHEKLESFRSDLVVAEAMERLYQQLNQPDIGIRMGEM